MTQRHQVLVADEDPVSAHWLSEGLARKGCSCRVAPSADAAVDLVQGFACSVAVCDARMLGTDKFELLKQLRNLQPKLPVIVETGPGLVLQAVEALKQGASQYVEKPVDIDKLLGIIDQIAPDTR